MIFVLCSDNLTVCLFFHPIMREKEQENAAILLQKHVRRFLVQKKYAIRSLPTIALEFYPTFIVGNDPMMHYLGKYIEKRDKIALIGTSGLRSLALALRLSPRKITPKIIIVDNSEEVYGFWYGMREIASKSETVESFFLNVKVFLKTNSDLYRAIHNDAYQSGYNPDTDYLKQNPLLFIDHLTSRYGYQSVRATLQHVSLIKQDWADEAVFFTIKNLLSYQGIEKVYMYPSNIVHCSDKITQERILNNIENFAPKLAIHTDLCEKHDMPENVYYITDHRPLAVLSTLFAKKSCQPLIVSPLSLFARYFEDTKKEQEMLFQSRQP